MEQHNGENSRFSRSLQGLPDHQCIEVLRDAIANSSLSKVNTIAQHTTKAKKRKQLQDVFVSQTQCEERQRYQQHLQGHYILTH